MSYADKLRKQREFTKAIGKFKFVCRRPTDAEAIALHRGGLSSFDVEDFEIAVRHTIGWFDVVEDDVIGGGGSSVVPFDTETCREWFADRPDFWRPLSTAILESYNLHTEKLTSAEKN
jgi:hypothetical protein